MSASARGTDIPPLLVWQQGRDHFGSAPTDFTFRRDIGGLFDPHPNNTFLLKMSYWFNP